MKGGMVQVQQKDGTWTDVFPVDGYKSIRAVQNIAAKAHRPAQLVNRKGNVLYRTKEV